MGSLIKEYNLQFRIQIVKVWKLIFREKTKVIVPRIAYSVFAYINMVATVFCNKKERCVIKNINFINLKCIDLKQGERAI